MLLHAGFTNCNPDGILSWKCSGCIFWSIRTQQRDFDLLDNDQRLFTNILHSVDSADSGPSIMVPLDTLMLHHATFRHSCRLDKPSAHETGLFRPQCYHRSGFEHLSAQNCACGMVNPLKHCQSGFIGLSTFNNVGLLFIIPLFSFCVLSICGADLRRQRKRRESSDHPDSGLLSKRCSIHDGWHWCAKSAIYFAILITLYVVSFSLCFYKMALIEGLGSSKEWTFGQIIAVMVWAEPVVEMVKQGICKSAAA